MNFFKLMLLAIKKYWLTIVGSAILVASWYFEKVTVSKHIDRIANAKDQRKDYHDFIVQRLINTLASELTLFMHHTDSNTYKIGNVIDAYTGELRTIETLRNSGKAMRDSAQNDEAGTQLFNEFFKNQAKINQLFNSQDFAKVNAELKKGRLEALDFTLEDQTYIQDIVVRERQAIERIQKLTLLFYAIGILLITMDKVKDTVRNNNDELRLLLSQVKEQNTKLLHRKDKTGK